MKKPIFASIFARDLDQFLEFKKSMGCVGDSRVYYLRRFDRYCVEHEVQQLSQEAVEGWIISTKASQSGSAPSWMSYIRDFGRWMRTHGRPEAYVLGDQWRAGFTRTQPYLLSRTEIVQFFHAAAHLAVSSPWQWQGTAFFGLMHSCGLRTCEVQRLRVQDVDLRDRSLDILWSKGNRSRRLPLTDQLTEVLAVCDQHSRACFGAQRATFFTTSSGAPVNYASPGVMFNRIWDQAGLERAEGGKKPRAYDFRHHFAYANLERWMAEGTDVGAMLPYLARYMGHASLDSTYYYVHTSPDFLSDYAQLTADSPVTLPEVGFE